MSTSGPNPSQTQTETQNGGSAGKDWTDAELPNVEVSDNVYASLDGNLTGTLPISFAMDVSDFAFVIPGTDTIDGITVNIEAKGSGANPPEEFHIQLLKALVVEGEDKATNTLTTSDVVYTHGGASDLWAGTWAASDINATGFGVRLQYIRTSANRQPQIDFISITIDHTSGAATTIPVFINHYRNQGMM